MRDSPQARSGLRENQVDSSTACKNGDQDIELDPASGAA